MDSRFTRHDIHASNFGEGVVEKVAHTYTVKFDDGTQKEITFQKGALSEKDSVQGIFNEDLALIMYHRHLGFSETKFCAAGKGKESNDKMIQALEDYMGACFGRRIERVIRTVSGTHKL